MSVINNLPQGGGGNIIKDLAKASTFSRVTMSSEQSAQNLYNTLTLSDGAMFFALGDSSGGLYRSTGEIGEAAIEIAPSGSFTYMVETENYALIGGTFVAGTVYLYNKSTKAATLLTFSTSGTWYKLYPVKALEDTDGIWVVVCGGTSSSNSYYYIGWCDTSANTFTLVTSYKAGTKSYANPRFSSVDNLLLTKTTTGVIAAGNGGYTLHIRRSDRAAVGAATSYSTNTVELAAYGGGKYVVGAYGSLTTSSTAYIVTVNATSNTISVDSTNKGNVRAMYETSLYSFYGISGASSTSDTASCTAVMHRVSKSNGTDEALSTYKIGCTLETDDGWIAYGNYNVIWFIPKTGKGSMAQISSSVTIRPYNVFSVKVGDDYLIGNQDNMYYFSSANRTISAIDMSVSGVEAVTLKWCLSKDGQYLYVPGNDDACIYKYHVPDLTLAATYTTTGSLNFLYCLDDGRILYTCGGVYIIDTDDNALRIFDGGAASDNLAVYRKGDILIQCYQNKNYSEYNEILLINTKTLECCLYEGDKSFNAIVDAAEQQCETLCDYR